MEIIQITSKIAAILAVLMFILTMMVSLRRVELGKEHGDIAKFPYQDGDDEKLKRRIRAFGNFIEYTPMCIIMLGLLEVSGGSSTLIWALGSVFVVGRILHAAGMLTNPHFPLPRIIGMFATYAILVAPAIWFFL